MGILKIIFSLFILAFPIAEIGRIQFSNGIALSINDILLSFLIFVWIIYKLIKREKIKRSSLTKPIFIFIAIASVSLIFNIQNLSLNHFFVSSLYLVRWIFYGLLFFIVKDFDNRFKNKIPYLMLISGITFLLIGYIQYFYYPSLKNLFYLGWDEHLYRMFSSFLDPNYAGTFYVILFIFILGLFYKYYKKKLFKNALILGIAEIFVLLSIYLTYSRSAFIMLVLTISTFLVLIRKFKAIIVTIILLLLIILFIPKSFQTEGTNLFRTFSSQQRITSSEVALSIFQKNPVFGVGFNAYRYAQNKSGLNNKIWQTTHSGAGTDNSFLFVLATTGVLGLICYLYLILKIFDLGRINLKTNIYSLVLISSFLGLIFNSFFINSLFYIFILEWLWIIASLTENN